MSSSYKTQVSPTEVRYLTKKGVIHREGNLPAIINYDSDGNEFVRSYFNDGELHNEYGGAIQMFYSGVWLDAAYYLRNFEFKTLQEYEKAVYEMNKITDSLEEILQNNDI